MPDLGEYLFGGSRGSKIGMVVLPFMCMKTPLIICITPQPPT